MALPLDDVCAIHVYSDGDLATTTPAVAEFCGVLGKPWITEEFGVCRSVFHANIDRAARAQHAHTSQLPHQSGGSLFWNLGPAVSEATCDINAAFPLNVCRGAEQCSAVGNPRRPNFAGAIAEYQFCWTAANVSGNCAPMSHVWLYTAAVFARFQKSAPTLAMAAGDPPLDTAYMSCACNAIF
jgi:hypothetical protein